MLSISFSESSALPLFHVLNPKNSIPEDAALFLQPYLKSAHNAGAFYRFPYVIILDAPGSVKPVFKKSPLTGNSPAGSLRYNAIFSCSFRFADTGAEVFKIGLSFL